MNTFEQILLGVVALLILAWMWPGVRAAMQRSREAGQRDWTALLLPLGGVILVFVILVLLARS